MYVCVYLIISLVYYLIDFLADFKYFLPESSGPKQVSKCYALFDQQQTEGQMCKERKEEEGREPGREGGLV